MSLQYRSTSDSTPGRLRGLPALVRNRLLGALTPDDLSRIAPTVELVCLRQGDAVFVREEQIRHVYFPETAVISLVTTLQNGSTIEVGTVGNEGLAGLPLFFGDDVFSLAAFTQIGGVAMRVDADAFTRLASGPGALHQLTLRYAQAFLTQVAQTAACTGAHLVEQRCARWLLMTHDRVEGDDFHLTQEFLAIMLGVRRAGVSVAMSRLQDAGLVQYARGWMSIRDRAGLEAASCECYGVVRAHFERLLPTRA